MPDLGRTKEAAGQMMMKCISTVAVALLCCMWSFAERNAELAALESHMVLVSRGTFQMGDTLGDCITGLGGSGELPVHPVKLGSYSFGKFLVAFDQCDTFCEATAWTKPYDEGWGRGDRPAIHISWYDAVSCCDRLSLKAGLAPCYLISGSMVTPDWEANGYRLPTEAEWEYAGSRKRQERPIWERKDYSTQ